MIPLTPRQRKCLAFIKRYEAAHGLAPTLEEMRVALGCRSRGSVHSVLTALERRGRIRRLPRFARALMVVREDPKRYGRILESAPVARTLPLARWGDVS